MTSIFKVKLIPPTEETTKTYGQRWPDGHTNRKDNKGNLLRPLSLLQAKRIYDRAFNAILKETRKAECLGEDEEGFMCYRFSTTEERK
jgi:hypothetical protein